MRSTGGVQHQRSWKAVNRSKPGIRSPIEAGVTQEEEFMKYLKLAVAAAAALAFNSAYAFHDGGVATCSGCHVMHNATNGVANSTLKPNSKILGFVPTGQPAFSGVVNSFLLKGADQSSTCLSCHQGTGSYKVYDAAGTATGVAPGNFSPGGDFAWTKKSTSWTSPRSGSHDGARSGHNIVAKDFGLLADVTMTKAPGGSLVQSNMQCNSCHDPHGRTRLLNDGTFATTGAPIVGSGSYASAYAAGPLPPAGEAYGVYRLLNGTGVTSSAAPGVTFNAVPVVVAPDTYNQDESVNQTKVAYGSGVSEWCGSCHPGIHSKTAAGLVHPTDNVGGALNGNLAIYNSYVKSGDLSNTQATSYISLVPYQENNTDRQQLAALAKSDSPTYAGPVAGASVMCLSCHRAHATGFDSMVRWNPSAEFLTVDGQYANYVAGSTNEFEYGNYSIGRTATENAAAYYKRPATAFATFQRQLCNKCHAKD